MTTEQTINEAAKKVRQEKTSKPAAAQATKPERRPFTLAVDIGGTGIKAEKLDSAGKPVTERTKIATPKNASPKKVAKIIDELAEQHGSFDRVSVGFPRGVKKSGVYSG